MKITSAIRAVARSLNDRADHIDERIGVLNETLSTAAQRPAISQAERDRRQCEVDFARGSVAYEGGVLTEETERINARYVAGEISGDEMTAAILERYATRP